MPKFASFSRDVTLNRRLVGNSGDGGGIGTMSGFGSWTVLNTGLASNYVIGKPTEFTVNDLHYFGLTGGTNELLTYNPTTGTFVKLIYDNDYKVFVPPDWKYWENYAYISTLDLTVPPVTVMKYTGLSNLARDSFVYGAFRTIYQTSPFLSYIDAYRSSVDGQAYTGRKGGGSGTYLPNSPYIGETAEVYAGFSRFTFVDKRGYYSVAANGGSVTTYSGSTYAFASTYDCYSTTFDGTNTIVAGGSDTTGKIYTTTSPGSSGGVWTLVSNTFGQGISKVANVNLYLNWSPYPLNPDYPYVTGSKTKILLIGGLNGKIARSLDGGYTWTDATTQPFTTGDKVTGFAASNIYIFAVTSTGKIARSSNGGVDWVRVNIGASPTNLEFITWAPNWSRLYIGGAGGFLAYFNFENIIIS